MCMYPKHLSAGLKTIDEMDETTGDPENAPIATATRVPPEESESDDDPENAPIATVARVA